MKSIFKFLFRTLIVLILVVVVFYFWASSASLDKADYATITKTEYVSKPKNDSIFSILTYNIGYLSGMTNNRAVAKPQSLFDDNLKKVKSEFKSLNPDIIAFQEIDYNASRSYKVNQEEEISKLGYAYKATAVNWDERYLPFPYWPPKMHFGKVISGQSILSKFAIENQERIVLERVADAPFYRDAFYLERLAQVAKVTIDNREVVIINVHLEAFDKTTRVNQFKKIVELLNSHKDDYPVILLGDFNSPANDKDAAIQQLLNDTSLGNAAFETTSFENTFDSKDPFKRIDYIFYTKNSIQEVSSKVLNEFGEASDHIPVYLEFAFVN